MAVAFRFRWRGILVCCTTRRWNGKIGNYSAMVTPSSGPILMSTLVSKGFSPEGAAVKAKSRLNDGWPLEC